VETELGKDGAAIEKDYLEIVKSVPFRYKQGQDATASVEVAQDPPGPVPSSEVDAANLDSTSLNASSPSKEQSNANE